MKKCWCGKTMTFLVVKGIQNDGWYWRCRKHGTQDWIVNLPSGVKPTKRQLGKKRPRYF